MNQLPGSQSYEDINNLPLQSISIVNNNFNNNFYNSHQYQIAVQIICKIIQRNYSRHFIKRLTFAFIQSLRKPRVKAEIAEKRKKQQIDWPFKHLYYKKNRTHQEQQYLQFANLCATMIQSKFKSYITRKRHVQAISRAKKTKQVLEAFFKRWKVYRTYNCQKVFEIRRKIKQIQKQIDEQEQKFNQRDAKKLKGLYKYLQIYTKMFKDTFHLLMETGMWTLQKNMRPKAARLFKKQKKIQRIQHQNQDINIQIEHQNQISQKKQKIERTPKLKKNQNKKQNLDQNVSNQFLDLKNNSYSGFQDNRPIKAAGKYQFSQLENTQENSRNYSKAADIKQLPQAQNVQQNLKKAKQKLRKAQQLQKRKKYDPRKAIQEEKQRKKEQDEQKKSQGIDSQNFIVQPKKANKKEKQNSQKEEPGLKGKTTSQIKEQSELQKPKKTIKVAKKQSKLQQPKKQVQVGKQTIKKVSSKVDCWVNKKQPEPDWVKQYKSKILQNRKESEQKNSNNLRNSIQKYNKYQQKGILRPKIDQQQYQRQRQQQAQIQRQKQRQMQRQKQRQNQRQRQRQRQSILGDYKRGRINSEQRAQVKNNYSWQSRQQQIQNLKQKQNQYFGMRKNSAHNLQQQVRMMLEKKNNLRKKQVHRPIEELQQTYNRHYSERFQNLMPKLSLLAVARNQQKGSNIPVLSDQSQEFNNQFEQIYNSTRFWKIATQNDKIYKSFITS